jgi:monoamine oxidase
MSLHGVNFFMSRKVIVVGGGAAGLAACSRLADCQITLLEARNRFGGRIHTMRRNGQVVELGAEFMHGQSKALSQLIADANLVAQPASDDNYLLENGMLEAIDVWEQFDKLVEHIDPMHRDESFATFLDRQSLPERDRKMMLAFATGFNAAHAERLSAHSLKRAEFAAEQMDGDKQSRIVEGYGALVEFLVAKARDAGAQMLTGRVVRSIRWRAGNVEVEAQDGNSLERFFGDGLIVTLPLGVLKKNAVTFVPPLTDKEEAICGLDFGNVVKLTFVFRKQWWARGDFGFIYALEEPVPTWWTDQRGPVLTGWAGGTKADRLIQTPSAELQSLGVEILSRIFRVSSSIIRQELLAMETHDWSRDPYACGAYTSIPVNGMILPKLLAAPVEETLFFAGEATASDAQLGTVFAAIETGYRAADKVTCGVGRVQ